MAGWLILPEKIIKGINEKRYKRTIGNKFSEFESDIQKFIKEELEKIDKGTWEIFMHESMYPGETKLRAALNERSGNNPNGIFYQYNKHLADLLCCYAFGMNWKKTLDFLNIKESDIFFKTYNVIKNENALSFLPIAPKPYIAHPYGIVKNYTGRKEEIQQLTKWVDSSNNPMLIIEAIGGMGKTSVSWKWLHDEIVAVNRPYDGIVWWSFYDQGFEDFLECIYEYCYPQAMRDRQHQPDKTVAVINALCNRRFILILDGLERILRGYAHMTAMYKEENNLSQNEIDAVNESYDVHQRTPITPRAGKLLTALCTGNSKTIITTRLFPATIEGLDGIQHLRLTGFSKHDTIAFFKLEGIVGSEYDMSRAGKAYGNHPLMLKLLCSALKRSFTKDIKNAFLDGFFTKRIIDEKEPQKILSTSFQLLNKREKKVVTTISVFRTAFTFNAVAALFKHDPYKTTFDNWGSDKLARILSELVNLGFLLHSEQEQLLDFHPIMRSFLYDKLTDKRSVHKQASDYFAALPEKEISTLNDLEPIIELFHHLIRVNNFNDAYGVYRSSLAEPLESQLSLYNIGRELLEQILNDPRDIQDKIPNESRRASFFYRIGGCYLNLGEINLAIDFFKKGIITYYYFSLTDAPYKGYVSIYLRDLAFAYLLNGKFCAAIVMAKKAISFSREHNLGIDDECYSILGNTLFLQGNFKELASGINYSVEDYIQTNDAIEPNSVVNSNILLNYIKCMLLKFEFQEEKDVRTLNRALDWSLKIVKSAEHSRLENHVNPNRILNGYEAIARTLVTAIKNKIELARDNRTILFYDESFQIIVKEVSINSDYFAVAEECIHMGQTISSSLNRVYFESTFLYLYAYLQWLKIENNGKFNYNMLTINENISVAYSLANAIGHQILLADIHILCEEVLAKIQSIEKKSITLLGLSINSHWSKITEIIKDKSLPEDLLLPDCPKGFYDEIPESIILSRGLSNAEQDSSGYNIARLKSFRNL